MLLMAFVAERIVLFPGSSARRLFSGWIRSILAEAEHVGQYKCKSSRRESNKRKQHGFKTKSLKQKNNRTVLE